MSHCRSDCCRNRDLQHALVAPGTLFSSSQAEIDSTRESSAYGLASALDSLRSTYGRIRVWAPGVFVDERSIDLSTGYVRAAFTGGVEEDGQVRVDVPKAGISCPCSLHVVRNTGPGFAVLFPTFFIFRSRLYRKDLSLSTGVDDIPNRRQVRYRREWVDID